MPRDDRFVDMSLYELPDDEPLSEAELRRLEQQRIESQARLINHSASMGMTPMEAFAAGRVTAEMPDDRLAFDQSRQLPAASGSEVMADVRKTIDQLRAHNIPPMPTGSLPTVGEERGPARSYTGSRVQEWFDSGKGGAPFMEGFNSYFTPATEVTLGAPVFSADPVDDNEVVDAELLPLSNGPDEDDDIVEAEIVE